MYNVAEWSDLFVASAGAAAALAGLVIVAVSVNIKEILKYKWLPDRVAVTIGLLVLVLIVSIAGLIKSQPAFWFGTEILIFSLVVWWLALRVIKGKVIERKKDNRPRSELVVHIVTNQGATVPFIIAGIMLVVGNANGLYWLAAGIIAAFVVAMLNAWVLLIEILR